MIAVDLGHLSSPLLCKAADWWAWAMQSQDHPADSRADAKIFVVAGLWRELVRISTVS